MNYIVVLVTVCLSLTDATTCKRVPVVNNDQDNVHLGGCLSLEGFESAKQFWEQHPIYHTWHFKGWSCSIGNKPPIKESTG